MTGARCSLDVDAAHGSGLVLALAFAAFGGCGQPSMALDLQLDDTTHNVGAEDYPGLGTRLVHFAGNPLTSLESSNPWGPSLPDCQVAGETIESLPGAVHADVKHFPGGMDGFEFWMVFTPFEHTPETCDDPENRTWERMTLVRSHDGVTWQAGTDYTNPLIVPGDPNQGEWDANFHADPDLVYAPSKGPQGESWFLYFQGMSPANKPAIGVALSHDGKHYVKHVNNPIVASNSGRPTVVYSEESGIFRMWYNHGNYNNSGDPVWYAESVDGIHFSAGQTVMVPQHDCDQGGITHMDVIVDRGKFVMYYLGQPGPGYRDHVVMRATSTDGLAWTDRVPVLSEYAGCAAVEGNASAGSWSFWSDINGPKPVASLYRPTAVMVNNALYLYYGGIDVPEIMTAPIFHMDIGLAFSSRYSDVPPVHWAYAAVETLSQHRVTSGCRSAPPLFCPERVINRAEAAVFIVLGAGLGPLDGPSRFVDVSDDSGYKPFINRLHQNSITNGCGRNTNGEPLFCPTHALTRAQAAVFTVAALADSPSAVACDKYFADVCGHWAAGFINRLAELEIVVGCNTGEFCPDRQITRAEMAAITAEAFFTSE